MMFSLQLYYLQHVSVNSERYGCLCFFLGITPWGSARGQGVKERLQAQSGFRQALLNLRINRLWKEDRLLSSWCGCYCCGGQNFLSLLGIQSQLLSLFHFIVIQTIYNCHKLVVVYCDLYRCGGFGLPSGFSGHLRVFNYNSIWH